MFNDLFVGPFLGVVEPNDIPKHWIEMQKYGLLPLIEDKNILLKAALPLFPKEFDTTKIKSVLITIGYTQIYTA